MWDEAGQGARPHLDRLKAVLSFGSARIFEDQRPFPFVLEKEDPLFSIWSIRVFDPLNEIGPLLIVESDVAVDHLR